MILKQEFRDIARLHGVPESTVERDYAQNWLLKSINDLDRNFILKGGTGIRKAHIADYRFSDDLDFGMLVDMTSDHIKIIFEKAISNAREEVGIQFEPDVLVKKNVNGYEGSVYFRILRRSGSPHKIKLDITNHDMEILIFPIATIPINHPFSDELSGTAVTYTLEESFTEKVRALFQRTRPRDLYDVWYLSRLMNPMKLKDAILQKCGFRGITPNIVEMIQRKDFYQASWKSSLKHQMKDLPDFESTFRSTIDTLRTTLHGD